LLTPYARAAIVVRMETTDSTVTKVCCTCHKDLPLSSFFKSSKDPAKLRGYCKACGAENDRRRRKRLGIVYTAYDRVRKAEWVARNKDKHQAYRRKHVAANIEHYRERQRGWRADHKDRMRAHVERWRARRKGAPGYTYTTPDLLFSRWAMYGNRCYVCGKPAQATDHIIPLSEGGTHYPANLRPICGSCNSKKKNIWPHAFAKIFSFLC
jgi:5-methylcytosine-specific restriction endonuclease McrA